VATLRVRLLKGTAYWRGLASTDKRRAEELICEQRGARLARPLQSPDWMACH